MVIAAVDPNKQDLKLLTQILRFVYPGCQVLMFSDARDASKYIQDNPIDVLYTEITMLGVSGFDLQAAVESVQPAVLTVFVTSTEVHATKAIQTRATGYIVKPVTTQSIRESLNETKFSITRSGG